MSFVRKPLRFSFRPSRRPDHLKQIVFEVSSSESVIPISQLFRSAFPEGNSGPSARSEDLTARPAARSTLTSYRPRPASRDPVTCATRSVRCRSRRAVAVEERYSGDDEGSGPEGPAPLRHLVELGGFEPPTFSLRTRRATNCAIAPRYSQKPKRVTGKFANYEAVGLRSRKITRLYPANQADLLPFN